MKLRILFIHGMFLTPKSWANWETYFTSLGYECESPAWPLHEGEPSQLRTNVPDGLGKLELASVYSHYASLLAGREPAILIGHSMGGLIVQKLIAAGIGLAGVPICTVAPNKMMALDWGFFRNTVAITNPLAGDEVYEMTPEGFHKNFGNTMTEEDSNAAFAEFAVHESRQVLRDILGSEGEIDTDKPHAPLLFIGAEKDEIIPASLVQRNALAYKDERSHSEYREFSSRGHYICGQDGWEEVALSISNWLEAHLVSQRS